MSLSLERFHHSEGEPEEQADTTAEPPAYGFIKRLSDCRAAYRDARSGNPVYSKKPKPTDYVEELFTECVRLVAAENDRWTLEAGPLRKRVAVLTQRIQETLEDLHNKQRSPYNGVTTADVEVYRREEAYGEIRGQLARDRIMLAALTADIESLCNRHLSQLNQIVGYSWRRIAKYRTTLIRAHPEGDRLSTVITWGSAELANALVESGEVEQKLIRLSGSHIAITSGEKGKED